MSFCVRIPVVPACHIHTTSAATHVRQIMFAMGFTIPALHLDYMFNDIGSWWANADAHDFGMMAIGIVVGVWFLTKYYSD